ncbi:hypothetical protein VMCG_07822 [Cytospora schulzeri]|uniref:Small secreted protein n=1 Tax=Cytospora schulzeri TaxID=448051 RepID=A0A423VZT8_9PEZI|nr:hypothetical protein VMCG_07822 [Valsa malicola]
MQTFGRLVLPTAALLAGLLQLPSVVALQLNITALGAANNASTLECWQMDTPFAISTQQGTSGSAQLQLGNASTMSYSVLPAQYDAGVHNAPANQWVIFLTGLAYITLPADNTTSAYVSGGQFGLIFAADTSDVSGTGHSTAYPGITETVAIQIPTQDGEIPLHTILHNGPCTANDTIGLVELAAGSS